MMLSPATFSLTFAGTNRCLALVCVLLIASCLWSDSVAADVPGPIVTTQYGQVQGVVSGNINIFKGIPFAAPPVNNLRFKPPQPPTPWNGIRQANQEPPICMQIPLSPVPSSTINGQEDCLYLDVYAPSWSNTTNPSQLKLPVMVWIYGGGFVDGDLYEFGAYDGQKLADTFGVVVVTFNYRVGFFGFLALNELFQESGTTGNYGMLDQVMALKWVQTNIANFSGDPAAVTIFGESAGAFSVCWHLASTVSQGLFRAAIMESGTCGNTAFFQHKAQSTCFGQVYISAVTYSFLKGSCDPSDSSAYLACIRSKDAIDLMKTSASWGDPSWPDRFVPPSSSCFSLFAPVMPWGPTVDGMVLTDQPIQLMRQGNFNRVPVILGTNQNEGRIFTLFAIYIDLLHRALLTTEQTLKVLFDDSAVTTILNAYPESNFTSSFDRLGRILRDFMFVCPNRRAARAISAYASTYLYHFTFEPEVFHHIDIGVYHSEEIQYVFGNPRADITNPNKVFNATELQMVQIFGTYWTNLAKYLDPNGPAGHPNANYTWPPFSTTNESNIIMNVPVQYQAFYDQGPCNMWDTITEKTYPYLTAASGASICAQASYLYWLGGMMVLVLYLGLGEL